MEVLPLGITTRARFQKSSPMGGASGAFACDLLARRAVFLLIALSEYLTVVFFCVITVCLPRYHLQHCLAFVDICVHIFEIHGRGLAHLFRRVCATDDGMWSAHMLSMFTLKRPEIVPVGGYGVRAAIKRVARETSHCADWVVGHFSNARSGAPDLTFPPN
jgi:hypothetical protein